jgi:hypothetical protein
MRADEDLYRELEIVFDAESLRNAERRTSRKSSEAYLVDLGAGSFGASALAKKKKVLDLCRSF